MLEGGRRVFELPRNGGRKTVIRLFTACARHDENGDHGLGNERTHNRTPNWDELNLMRRTECTSYATNGVHLMA
ncbi:MAG: hypothetical protein ACJARS_001724 [bacterium]|jgi:hypothetical protein